MISSSKNLGIRTVCVTAAGERQCWRRATMPNSKIGPIVGAILAGGRAKRLGGGDRGLHLIGGKAILARVIERLRPQVDDLVLNANGDPARFAPFGLPV